MSAAQISQPVQYVTVTGAGAGAHMASVKAVSGSTVDIFALATGATVTSLPYVEVGGTPPTGVPYAQEITLA